ncbi:GNAT family N-acetyltransferase [Coralliovum pocilloporae]|uniref:GNAT family N-acetyltransferase n=1 Tax=Coralliovum pocilloporae TaxID=3066369 RepID=UPI0033078CBB
MAYALDSWSMMSGLSTPRYLVEYRRRFHAAELLQELRDLEFRAGQANCFYGADFLVAAQETILAREPVSAFLVWRDNGPDLRRLVGFMPGQVRNLAVAPEFQLLDTRYNPYYEPLIDPDCLTGVVDAVLGLAKERKDLPSIFNFGSLVLGSPFAETWLKRIIGFGGVNRIVGRYHRPAVNAATGNPTEIKDRLSPKARYRVKHGLRALSELGEVRFESLSGTDPGKAQAVSEFLVLESLGWKGSGRTALVCQADTARFALKLARSRNLRVERLMLDGQAIAASLNLTSGRKLFGMKMAYDETYAKHSPGTLLAMHLAETFQSNPDVRVLDSGTGGGHHLLRFWPDRIECGRVISSVSQPGHCPTAITLGLHSVPFVVKDHAKRVRDMVRLHYTGNAQYRPA